MRRALIRYVFRTAAAGLLFYGAIAADGFPRILAASTLLALVLSNALHRVVEDIEERQ